MKKLLIFHPYLAPYRVDFFNRINSFFDLKIYFQYTNDPAQKFDTEILRSNVEFNYDYLLHGFQIFKRQIRFNIWKIVMKERPNVIITHEFAFFSFFVLLNNYIRFKKVRHIITTDDSMAILNNLPWYRKIAKSILLRFIDGLITISADSKEWHISHYPWMMNKIVDMPILQDEKVFRKKLETALPIAREYIKKYDLQGKKIILFLGRLVKVKGIDFLVEEIIKLENRDIVFIIVGEGELKEIILNKIIENDDRRIILAGRYDGLELIAWYNVASCFILPSTYEPFGAVINEALISGLYVLCSKYAGASCLIDGENGEIIDPLNKDSFRRQISSTLDKLPFLIEYVPYIKKNMMKLIFEEKMNNLIAFLNI